MSTLTVLASTIQANTNPGISPNTTGLPGLSVLQTGVGAFVFWALVLCVAALVVSAVALGFSKVTGRGGFADTAKSGVMWSAAAAVVIGGANAIIAFFANAGTGI